MPTNENDPRTEDLGRYAGPITPDMQQPAYPPVIMAARAAARAAGRDPDAILTAPPARLQAAYVESEHPRDPGGEGGGQWIAKTGNPDGPHGALHTSARAALDRLRHDAQTDARAAAQLAALEKYGDGAGAFDINATFRGTAPTGVGGLDEQQAGQAARDMQSLYGSDRYTGSSAETELLYRGVALPADTFKPGAVLTEPGFLSATSNANDAQHFAIFSPRAMRGDEVQSVVLRLHVPPRTRVLAGDATYEELILQAGSRYEVMGPSSEQLPRALTIDVRLLP